MCELFVHINKLPMKVLMYGETLKEDNNSNEINDIILLIPGTIGLPTFYDSFLRTIHKETGYPIWAIGHAGHDVYIDKNQLPLDLPPLENNEDLYGIEGQIEHKVAFIDKYVPKNARIYLIGHSIGSHIALKLMERPWISERVERCYNLFPVIENLKTTRNGLLFKYVKLLLGIILFFTWIFTLLPKQVQIFLVRIYLFLHGRAEQSHTDSVIRFLTPHAMDKVFFMLFNEMELVKDKNNDLIRSHSNKIKFYYGTSDGWVPIHYYKRLKEEIPAVDAELSSNFEHHFILHNSIGVGEMVASWFDIDRKKCN